MIASTGDRSCLSNELQNLWSAGDHPSNPCRAASTRSRSYAPGCALPRARRTRPRDRATARQGRRSERTPWWCRGGPWRGGGGQVPPRARVDRRRRRPGAVGPGRPGRQPCPVPTPGGGLPRRLPGSSAAAGSVAGRVRGAAGPPDARLGGEHPGRRLPGAARRGRRAAAAGAALGGRTVRARPRRPALGRPRDPRRRGLPRRRAPPPAGALPRHEPSGRAGRRAARSAGAARPCGGGRRDRPTAGGRRAHGRARAWRRRRLRPG